MANTVYMTATTQEVDANSSILNSEDTQTTASFTERNVGTITIATGAGYTALAFAGVASATMVRCYSTTAFSLKVNGGSEIIASVKDFICYGTFTALSVSQSSGADATIYYEIRG